MLRDGVVGSVNKVVSEAVFTSVGGNNGNVPVPTIAVIRFHRDEILAWLWMPWMLNRIAKFCVDMDLDTSVPELLDMIRMLFASGDSRLVLYGVAKDGGLVGHLLALPEPVNAAPPWDYLLIRQAQTDPKVDVRGEARQVMEAVKTWAKAMKVRRIVMLTPRNHRAMARKWGFVFYKTLMKLDVGDGDG